MYQTGVYNEDGELICTEYVNDSYEQAIADAEEEQMMADDPFYAQSVENERWYASARAAFEERGISVPYDVEYALAREMRRKDAELTKQKALQEVMPYVEAIEEMGYSVHYGYSYPTPAEVGYPYIDEIKGEDGEEVDNETFKKICKALEDKDLPYIEDYLCY